MIEVYYKGLIGIDPKKFVGCIFLDEDLTNPAPVQQVELTLLSDGSTIHFKSPDEFSKIVSHEKRITKLEYNILCMLSKLSSEIFLSGYVPGYPHRPAYDTLATYLKENISKYKGEWK